MITNLGGITIPPLLVIINLGGITIPPLLVIFSPKNAIRYGIFRPLVVILSFRSLHRNGYSPLAAYGNPKEKVISPLLPTFPLA